MRIEERGSLRSWSCSLGVEGDLISKYIDDGVGTSRPSSSSSPFPLGSGLSLTTQN